VQGAGFWEYMLWLQMLFESSSGLCVNSVCIVNIIVTFALDADERRLSLQLQQQLDEATMELQQRTLDFELGGSGAAAAQRYQQELAELGALRNCNTELLAEVRSQQQQLKAKDFVLATQKATAAAAADKAASTIRRMEEQVVL
jgi:hypothetical protein